MKRLLPLLSVCSVCSVGHLAAADIVALCIGNNAYVTPEDVLDTPVNDARLMHQTLRAVPGVQAADIVLLEDARRSQITLALRQFKARAAEAKLALIFYSGHGVEDTPTGYDRAETFLLPVDAVINSADDLPDKAVPLKTVLEALEGTRGAARGVILDCCRSGAPGATKSLARAGKNLSTLDESVKKALGGAILPEGTLIAFAASPGRKAAAFLTESDTNSPFTRFISEQMSTQGGDLFSIVNAASRITKQRTELRQVPHVELRGDASLITDFSIPAARPVKFTPQPSGLVSNALPSTTTPAVSSGGGMSELEKLKQEVEALKRQKGQVSDSAPPTMSSSSSADTPPSTLPADLPATGFFERAELFAQGPYADFNTYSQTQILKRAQESLKKEGFYTGITDGIRGPGTQSALHGWQQAQGMLVSGRLDSTTIQKLGLSGIQQMTPPPPKPQATISSTIREIQERYEKEEGTPEKTTSNGFGWPYPVTGAPGSSAPSIPVAKGVPGKPGFYYSPSTGKIIDARDLKPGGKGKDPQTGEIFRLPGGVPTPAANPQQTSSSGSAQPASPAPPPAPTPRQEMTDEEFFRKAEMLRKR